MLKLLGHEASTNLTEYECTRCELRFRIGFVDGEEGMYLTPNYCPVCRG